MYIYGTRIEYFTCISAWNRLLRVFLCRSYCHLGIWHNIATLYLKLDVNRMSNISSNDKSNSRQFREWNFRNRQCVWKKLNLKWLSLLCSCIVLPPPISFWGSHFSLMFYYICAMNFSTYYIWLKLFLNIWRTSHDLMNKQVFFQYSYVSSPTNVEGCVWM